MRQLSALDEKIRQLCERKGLEFWLGEPVPWRVGDTMPKHVIDGIEAGTGWGWGEAYPRAMALRRRLIAEIEAGE
jgi:hypothetical protein